VKTYQKKGVKRLADAVMHLKYAMVARKKSFQPSVSNGEHTMQPGHYAATVMLYRLDDAALLGQVEIDENAPSFASVYTLQDRYGHVRESDINAGLDANTRRAFEDSVQRAFKARGVDIALGYDADK
jgi:hypothetical protein